MVVAKTVPEKTMELHVVQGGIAFRSAAVIPVTLTMEVGLAGPM